MAIAFSAYLYTDRAHRELTEADIEKISSAYHAWRDDRFLRQAQGTKRPLVATRFGSPSSESVETSDKKELV
ncbi:MAG TPA: hypothetical protein PLY93_12380 [Turneriella sp.]|nr:hypothetical protein [Turneriella sp.]